MFARITDNQPARESHSVSGRLERRLLISARAFSSPARMACFDLANNRRKALIMLMEATSGIEPEYTVLQTVA
jgi:hypothetical protein